MRNYAWILLLLSFLECDNFRWCVIGQWRIQLWYIYKSVVLTICFSICCADSMLTSSQVCSSISLPSETCLSASTASVEHCDVSEFNCCVQSIISFRHCSSLQRYNIHEHSRRRKSKPSLSSSSRTYRLMWHKLNTIASKTRYTNYKEKN